jgi:iron complex outermembrane recepter protein
MVRRHAGRRQLREVSLYRGFAMKAYEGVFDGRLTLVLGVPHLSHRDPARQRAVEGDPCAHGPDRGQHHGTTRATSSTVARRGRRWLRSSLARAAVTVVISSGFAKAAYSAAPPAAETGEEARSDADQKQAAQEHVGANPAEALELAETIEVVGTTPVPGLGTALANVPATVQTYGAKEVGRQRPLSAADLLERNAGGVNLNSGQGNLFQPDVSYRGFTASPLLGTPEGMSVFLDGVRVNEPFGDVVNWDLLPPSAISSIQLISGSTPALGLNTLGGALAVYTKSGTAYPGLSLSATGGSFGRAGGTFTAGGAAGHFDGFLTGNYLRDGGWALHNPSRIAQLFGKLGHQTEWTDLDLSLLLADNSLEGTQTLPRSWLDTPREAYTFPDLNSNRVVHANLKGSAYLTPQLLLGGNAYFRGLRSENTSSNQNADFEPPSAPGEPAPSTAFNDRSTIGQKGYGGALQLTVIRPIAGLKNQLALGAAADLGDVHFTQETRPAAFTANRGTVGTGDFVLETDVQTTNQYYGLYLTDTLTLTDGLSLNLSGRFNRAHVKIKNLGAAEDEALNSENTFTRFSPAVGLAWTPRPWLTAFATYNEGMRVPTPMELTCADPTAPCKLPNNFLADPPLKKVVSRTVELGGRGRIGKAGQWSAALFQTRLLDDIQFINDPTSGLLNSGFFANVGETRRRGVELTLALRTGDFAWRVAYSFVRATFETAFRFPSTTNSAALDTDADGVGDTVFVQRGGRIPGIPEHTLKVRAEWEVVRDFSIGASVVAASSIYARGDENNQDVNGKVPGYAIVEVEASYRIVKWLRVSVRADNLFDSRYSNLAVLGENAFTGRGRTFGPEVGIDPVAEQFRAVGAPRGAWVTVEYQFGAGARSPDAHDP